MRNFGKFISKHFFIYLSVVILIVLLDLLIFFLTFNGTVNSISENNPVQTLEKVSNNLTIQDGKYILNNRCQKDLITKLKHIINTSKYFGDYFPKKFLPNKAKDK